MVSVETLYRHILFTNADISFLHVSLFWERKFDSKQKVKRKQRASLSVIADCAAGKWPLASQVSCFGSCSCT